MSLNSLKRDLKDYIEENKALLEAWERVTYLTKKDGTPFKSMSKNFNNAIYKSPDLYLRRGFYCLTETLESQDCVNFLIFRFSHVQKIKFV